MLARKKTKAEGAVNGPGWKQRIETAALTRAANAPQRQQIALARQNRCSFLKAKKISAWSTRMGRMRKKFTAELSQAIEPASSRTAAGRPALRAKSGAASDQAGEELPSGSAIIVKLCLLPHIPQMIF